jgi:hypothetical protein
MTMRKLGLASLAAGAAGLVLSSLASPVEARPMWVPHGGAGWHGGPGFRPGWGGGPGFRPGWGGPVRPGWGPGWHGAGWRPGWGYRPYWGGGYWGGGWGGCGYWNNCGWGAGAAAAGLIGGLAIGAAAANAAPYYDGAYYGNGNNCAYVSRKVFIPGSGWHWTKRLECDY